MKTLTVGVPTGGAVIITRPRRAVDNGQQDLFRSYREKWIAQMVELIKSLPRPVAMSAARQAAAVAGMAAPLDAKHWYGNAMRAAGLRLVGYQKSPLKSRNGGAEGLWA